MSLTEEDLPPVRATQEKIKSIGQEEFQQIFKRMEFFLLERIEQGSKKWAMEFLEKITAYPNEAIHDDCVVTFTGGYEKIFSEKQSQRVDVDRWYST